MEINFTLYHSSLVTTNIVFYCRTVEKKTTHKLLYLFNKSLFNSIEFPHLKTEPPQFRNRGNMNKRVTAFLSAPVSAPEVC